MQVPGEISDMLLTSESLVFAEDGHTLKDRESIEVRGSTRVALGDIQSKGVVRCSLDYRQSPGNLPPKTTLLKYRPLSTPEKEPVDVKPVDVNSQQLGVFAALDFAPGEVLFEEDLNSLKLTICLRKYKFRS